MKYPSHIEANIHEISGNFYKEELIVNSPYSLHTEPSSVPKVFNSKIMNDFEHIKVSQKGNIPQLWYNIEWANEFYDYIDWLIGSNNPPDALEIHPPFNDYCSSFEQFLSVFDVFYQKFKRKYPATKIVIENRFGTRYTGGNFILSKCSDVLEFCKILSNLNIDLKIVLDYPQLFSAEVIKSKKEENWMGANPSKLVEKIISFNMDLKKYRELIVGLHMYGKLKTGNRWTTHAGNMDTFFSNNNELKHKFFCSVFSTFNDDIIRYFVPEVHSGENDFHSIVADMEKEGFIFISKSCNNFYNFEFFGIKIPINNIDSRERGSLEKNGWFIQFCFGKNNGKEYMDCYCQHRMTNDRHMRIFEDGKNESLLALDYFDYGFNPNDTEDVNNEKMKNKKREIEKLLIEKGFFPFPYTNELIININIYFKNNKYSSNKEFYREKPNAEFKELPYGIYLGDLLDNKPHGKGALFYANGNVFEGDFVDGELSKGKEIFSNGSIFEGDFANGEPSKGKETFKNDIVYEGDLVDGKGHGKGKMTFANGDVYEGDFFEGNINGIGKKTYIDGKVEEGFWANGIFFRNIEVHENK
jgi:hypothetical protein